MTKSIVNDWTSLVSQLVKNCLQCERPGFDPWFGRIPWRKERLPIPVFWPVEFYGPCSLWSHKEFDMTDQLSLSFIPLRLIMQKMICLILFHNSFKLSSHIFNYFFSLISHQVIFHYFVLEFTDPSTSFDLLLNPLYCIFQFLFFCCVTSTWHFLIFALCCNYHFVDSFFF